MGLPEDDFPCREDVINYQMASFCFFHFQKQGKAPRSRCKLNYAYTRTPHRLHACTIAYLRICTRRLHMRDPSPRTAST